jgi:predicted helicase
MVDWPRPEVNGHLVNSGNLGLVFMRQVASGDAYSHFIVSRLPVDARACYSNKGIMTLAPLYLTESEKNIDRELSLDSNIKRTNFTPRFLGALKDKLGSVALNFSPEDVLHYSYAVFHSPTYRSRYAEFLKIDFPRLPLTSSIHLFRKLSKLGEELTALHLLETSKLNKLITEYIGSNNFEVEKIFWSNNIVWINKDKTAGFKGVKKEVWDFQICGYQVCDKWLKDRKGRKLSEDDIEHYQKMIVALAETIRLMAEIDKVIDENGGLPKAFQ